MNIPVGLPSSPIQIFGKSVQGFQSYDQTNKQTPKQRLQLNNSYLIQRTRIL